MEQKPIELYEFLVESELQHYYNAMKNELKITSTAQLKYATDDDLRQIGLSRPEIRRLRKFYEKYYPHGYLSKIKRLIQTTTTTIRRDDSNNSASATTNSNSSLVDSTKTLETPKNIPNNKHIIPADAISVNKQLGVGEFGIVQQGVWTNGNDRIQVAIKCLSRERMQSNPMEFLKEAIIMYAIEHENIVRLYGVVSAADTLMLVTELAHLRSLLECLKDPGLRVSFLTVPVLCEFALQICNGMSYLENKRLIHRDLAARNILVFSKNKVKISDFGLSRALGVGKDYYKTNFNVNLKLPIAWCAPECITYLKFTNASDVWAYGVCLWEMFSYGFQPWAGCTGIQIYEAIDTLRQRLEQPDCCPREYYNLMMKCWNQEPTKRPKFSDIYNQLPDIKPMQLKAVGNCIDMDKDILNYRQGEIITVLERSTEGSFWKGVLNSGKTGLFNPVHTVAYVEGLPMLNRETFSRTLERTSKRKLCTTMISRPQDDFKHTGHVGIDGASFGDISFLSNPNSTQNFNNHVPRQIVTPYKPSEDIEQTPLLLPPTPTSPDSLQTASGYFSEDNPHNSSTNPTFVNSVDDTQNTNSAFNFPSNQHHSLSLNPFTSSMTSNTPPNDFGLNGRIEPFMEEFHSSHVKTNGSKWSADRAGTPTCDENGLHVYHEISDDDIATENVLGPSLLEEIDSMFGSMSTSVLDDNQRKMADLEYIIKKTENSDSFHISKGLKGKKGGSTAGTVKPISHKDERILNHAIEIANEYTARSMTDLVSDNQNAIQSPKRKFSFRFPNIGHNGEKDTSGTSGTGGSTSSSGFHKEKKKFCEELSNIADLQGTITEEEKDAYNSLIEKKSFESSAKTFPRRSIGDRLDGSFKQPTNNVTKSPSRTMTLPARTSTTLSKSKQTEDECESPSYILNNSYNFPDSAKKPNSLAKENLIALPPRDRNKTILTNPKRHVRKHPLIIPGNSVKRTLNIVTSQTDDEKNKMQLVTQQKVNAICTTPLTERNFRIYSNVNHIQKISNNSADTASLQFESILEDDQVNMMSSPDVIDGFCPFSINKEVFNKNSTEVHNRSLNDDELRNMDIERRKTIEIATNAGILQNANSVSSEDLLQFSKSPDGRERGIESDEVRTMLKVLGKDCTPERCLLVLEYLNWSSSDFPKAIKIIRLQNIVKLSLTECAEALEQYDWDLKVTSEKMYPFKK
ncbi:hypothetical protein ACFFRR_008400 [Megaselia abdita]